MPARNIRHVLVLTANADLAELYRQESPDCLVTMARDAAAVMRKTPKHAFDAVIVESRKDWMNEVRALSEADDLAPGMILVGGTAFLRRASEGVKALSNGQAHHPSTKKLPQDLGFEEFFGAKLRDFIRRMKLGAGSNLHSLLVNAVEKPLISLVLEETGGNKIQAAALLGLNRNTLQKKIKALRIPVPKRHAPRRPE